MDVTEILTRFRHGELDRAAVRELLGETPPAGPGQGPPSGGPEPVAVIGYSAQFPPDADAEQFWRLLLDGRDVVTEVDPARWPAEEFHDPDPAVPGRTISRWGGFLSRPDAFDAEFFGITPREAELMDPQARLFLQESYRAIEHAGLRPGALAGTRCGVQAAVMMNDYLHRIERESTHARLPQVMQGNSHSLLPARVAHLLDLRGPVSTVDTACSGSLVAVHQACGALATGEADLMLAGGVTLYLTEVPYVLMSAAGMLSPSGRCRPFDAAADGIVPGEGCGVVVLKRLADALADGDGVHGVIRASAVNHDGRTNGITAPSARSQADLLRGVYERSDVDPATIDYVECHGTGTPLGDPIEIAALNEAFRPAGLSARSVPLGSVKGNIGHASAAAGVAGLIKALGVARTGEVPPSLHCADLNPALDLDDGPFTVATSRQRLADTGRPRRVAVSSFGFSGTNAHVVVEQAAPRPPARGTGPSVVVLSGQRTDRLPARARDLLAALDTAALPDIAVTLAVHRDHFPHRVAWMVDDLEELRRSLLSYLAGQADPRRMEAGAPATPEDDLAAAAARYVGGADVDWLRVLPPANRVSLPGYPFAAESHWVGLRPGDASPPVPDEPAPEPAPEGVSTYHSVWVEHPLPATRAETDVPLLFVTEVPEGLVHSGPVEAVREPGEVAAAVDRLAGADALHVTGVFGVVRGREPFVRLLAVLREVLAAGWRREVRLVLATTDEVVVPALAGLVRSVTQESPRLRARVVLVRDAAAALPEFADLDPAHGLVVDIRSATRRRQVLVPATPEPGAQPFRPGTVHLVTGGAGGIGLALAEHLVYRRDARVVLCGRRAADDLPDGARRRLAALGDRARYVTADVTDATALRVLVTGIVREHGALHGVLHAAGLVRDAFLVRKPTEAVDEVLAPKVDGVLALDAATAGMPLEIFALFSSVASVVGNMGQCDYALANGYLDGFAAHRRDLVARAERCGRTLSIAWPLWRDGGMTISPAEVETLREQVGMVPMSDEDGLDTLELLLSADQPSPAVAVLSGDRRVWEERAVEAGLLAPPEPATGSRRSTGVPRDRVRALVAEVTGTHAGELAMDVPLAALGIDSLMIKTLLARLAGEFPGIGPEVFYGAPNLAAVADALAAQAPDPPPPAGPPAVPDRSPEPRPEAVAARLPAASKPGDPAGPVEPVAVVGLAGRFPGADTPEQLWRNLRDGVDVVGPVPPDRWGEDGGCGYFLTEPARFDPEFFGLSEWEARHIDPQERLFLATAWHALEDANLLGARLDALTSPGGRRRDVGVFVGVTSADYRVLGARRGVAVPGHLWSLPNRLSHLLDLTGPSQPVDTACSSSLVALHLAAESIRRGECAAAVVGGVNLYLDPARLDLLRRSGFLSADGRCRSFGAGGTGFGPGEAVSAVVLKPLAAALADGDQVRGVLLGGAVEHGGGTGAFTAPDPAAQARVLTAALERSGVRPGAVTVVEAHGTGTELGDPVELAGLADAYGRTGPACSLGSVKSAVGHSESAAGLTALTKVLLELEYREVVPTLHVDTPNPAVTAAAGRFHLQRAAEPWPAESGPRLAGISSFGAGGVNAHLVVREADPQQPWSGSDGEEVVVLSAPSEPHLRRTAARLAEWCRDTAASLPSIAHALRTGRAELPCRLATVVSSPAELAERLARYGADEPGSPVPAGILVNDVRQRRLDAEVFADGEQVRGFVHGLWHAGRERVARLWLEGLSVRWAELTPPPGGTLPRLPGSAMLEREFWLDGDPGPPLPEPRTPAPAASRPNREPEPTPQPAAGAAGGDELVGELIDLVGRYVTGGTTRPTPDSGLIDLGVESINVMNLRAEIEDRYGVVVPLDVLAGEASLSDIAEVLARRRPVTAGPVTNGRRV